MREFSFELFESIINSDKKRLDERFHKLVEDIACDNQGKLQFKNKIGPYDVITHLMGIIKYKEFIDVLNKVSDRQVSHYEVNQLDQRLLGIKFNPEDINAFKEHSIYPLRVTDYEIFWAVPDIKLETTPKLKMLLAKVNDKYIAQGLGLKNLAVKLEVVSNLTFLNLEYIHTTRKPVSQKDMVYKKERRLNTLLIDAIIHDATDVYFDSKKDHINVYFGIFNDKVFYKTLTHQDVGRDFLELTLIKFAGHTSTDLNWVDNPSKDMNINDIAGLGRYTGRIQILKNNFGISPVLRIQDTQRTVPKFKDINLSEPIKGHLDKLFSNPTGIILIAGATGNGKTTTIYACLDKIAKTRPQDRIEEISKPVEVVLEDISQISLEDNGTLNFDDVLEAQTRRNAKVIFLGEFNSAKSARFGVDAALQSKLLISTIHTDSVSLIPERIKGLVVSDPGAFEQFLEVVKGMAHQVMLKESCPICKKEVPLTTLSRLENEVLKAYGYTEGKITVNGDDPSCPRCQGRGYLINKPVICVELLEIDNDNRSILKEAMHEGKLRERVETLLFNKKLTGVHDALSYLESGKVTWEQIWNKYALWNTSRSIL